MSIEAINEQLLRAIGVGVALLDTSELRFHFLNDTIKEWFADIEHGQHISEIFPALDLDEVKRSLAEDGHFASETSFRMRRRTMTLALTINPAEAGRQQVAVLVCQNISRIKELESMIDSYSMMVERNTREIKREKEQVEKLLLNMMPRSVYEEYKTFGVVTPRIYESVAVLCLDFSSFVEHVNSQEAGVIVSELNDIYTALDRIGGQFGCERIKTVGDLYVTVAGMPDPSPHAKQSVTDAAVRFVRYLEQRNLSHPINWQCRIGVATGSVIGSVVGVQKYIYDVFGPAVLDALRLRSFADPMEIVATAEFGEEIDASVVAIPRGPVELSPDEPVELVSLSPAAEQPTGA